MILNGIVCVIIVLFDASFAPLASLAVVPFDGFACSRVSFPSLVIGCSSVFASLRFAAASKTVLFFDNTVTVNQSFQSSSAFIL